MAKKSQKLVKGIDGLLKAKERYEDDVSCGDVIAKALERFRTEGGLDVDGLTACLKDNDCALPNVDMKRHGSIGRFRMVAGLMLRAAARKRPVKIGGQTLGEKTSKKIEAPNKRGRKAKTASA
jgi:hypothetical protein